MRDIDLIRQSKKLSCGSAALATIMKYYLNIDGFDEGTALNFLDNKDSEATFLDLQNIAKKLNIESLGLFISKEEFLSINKPVIAYIKTPLEYDHFVVIKGIYGDNILIGDPAVGNYVLNKKTFFNYWLVSNSEKGKILYINIENDGKFFNIRNSEKKGQIIRFINKPLS